MKASVIVRPMTEVFSFPEELRARGLRASFGGRITGVAVSRDKDEALGHLAEAHHRQVEELGFAWDDLVLAEQVHGTGVAEVSGPGGPIPGVDGLLTARRGVLLGIHVADCAAVALVDQRTGALALLHSGRKGSEGGIVGQALGQMGETHGTDPGDVRVAISPCIRPPHYEIDFVGLIHEQLRHAGVPDGQINDCGICTGANVSQYYSYRMEQGNTGRMLALLGWKGEA